MLNVDEFVEFVLRAVAICQHTLQTVENHAMACKHLKGQNALVGVLLSVSQHILIVFMVIVSRGLAMSKHSYLFKMSACFLSQKLVEKVGLQLLISKSCFRNCVTVNAFFYFLYQGRRRVLILRKFFNFYFRHL